MKHKIQLVVLAMLTISLFGCQKATIETPKVEEPALKAGKITLKFDNVVSGSDLRYNTSYTNPITQERFEVFTCQYIISNIRLKSDDGKEYIVPQDSCYFLVDEVSQNSQNITLNNIPFGNYTEVSFIIGVDSAKSAQGLVNLSKGLKTAASNGMYWAWNSGFIFFRLEGLSNASPDHEYLFHIGGFSGNINNIKHKTLTFGTDKAVVTATKTPEISVKMDIMKVFLGSETVFIKKTHAVHFEPYSVKIANNYVNSFTLVGVKNP